jgi:hypothetical protein
MALVPIWSVYWPNAERTGPDLEQMNRIVQVDEEVARMRAGNRFGDLPGDGTARWPTASRCTARKTRPLSWSGSPLTVANRCGSR